MTELVDLAQKRTVHEALDAGWEAKDVWRAVCTAMDVPAERR